MVNGSMGSKTETADVTRAAPCVCGAYPDWVVLHIPHDSVVIPDSVRSQFVLDEGELAKELLRMTDRYTHELFTGRRDC